jgi:hypothetical protein
MNFRLHIHFIREIKAKLLSYISIYITLDFPLEKDFFVFFLAWDHFQQKIITYDEHEKNIFTYCTHNV